jgi:hypothetical protein
MASHFSPTQSNRELSDILIFRDCPKLFLRVISNPGLLIDSFLLIRLKFEWCYCIRFCLHIHKKLSSVVTFLLVNSDSKTILLHFQWNIWFLMFLIGLLVISKTSNEESKLFLLLSNSPSNFISPISYVLFKESLEMNI